MTHRTKPAPAFSQAAATKIGGSKVELGRVLSLIEMPLGVFPIVTC